jgi:WD40 repeat protein
MSKNNRSAFICDFVGCNKYFKEPITLPCGDMICKEHLNYPGTTFKCTICDEELKIPVEGLRINKKINALMIDNSHLTEQQREVKDLFDQLERLIENFHKSNLAHPQLYIHEYFSAIRNKIDLHRDQMIDSIHKRSEELLNKLKEMEQECYQNEARLEKTDYKEKNKDEMNKVLEKLREVDIKDDELIEMNDTINKTLLETKSQMNRFEKRLLMNKIMEFEANDSKKFGRIEIRNHLDLEIIKTLEGHASWVYCIEQINDSSKIITCSGDSSIKIWSTKSGECLKTLSGHTNLVTSLKVSNDQKYLISGSWDRTINVWNIKNDFECIQILPQEWFVCSLCLLPNNILVCGLADGTITKWNLNNFTKIDSFKAHKEFIFDLKHVSSSQIVSCSWDRKIKLWNLDKNECLTTFTGHTDSVNCLEISFDKSKLYSSSDDKSLIVWNISSGDCLNTIDLVCPIKCLKLLSSDLLAVGLHDKKENLKIIDLKSLETVKSCKSQSPTVRSLNFDSRKNVLFTGSDSGPVTMLQL